MVAKYVSSEKWINWSMRYSNYPAQPSANHLIIQLQVNPWAFAGGTATVGWGMATVDADISHGMEVTRRAL